MNTAALFLLRKELGFTQADMAERLGISLRAYTAIEKAEGDVPERYVLAIERLSLAVAVERRNPMLAAPAIRRDALELVNLIQYGVGGVQTTVARELRKP